MASLTEVQHIVVCRFRWEDIGFELDNLEQGLDDDWPE